MSYDVATHLQTNTSILGENVMFEDTTTSTQTILKQHHNDITRPILFTTNKQRSGIGRSENVWESPDGCLMFSLRFNLQHYIATYNLTDNIDISNKIHLIQYIVCIAIVNTIIQYDGKLSDCIKIKWPNDIYYSHNSNYKKLGGILCEAVCNDSGKLDIIIGTGINLFNTQPTICIQQIFDLLHISHKLSKPVLLAEIINNIHVYLQILIRDGFYGISKQYTQHWLHDNQIVEFNTNKFTIIGLSDSGLLLVKTADNNITELCSSKYSFDMINNKLLDRLVK